MGERVVAIANPTSGGGRTGRLLPDIERELRGAFAAVEVWPTTARGDATRLTRAAIDEGATLVVAVGGDGSINEVANGFLRDGEPAPGEAELGIVGSGTGGDFVRTVGVGAKTLAERVARLRPPGRPVDLGLVESVMEGQSRRRAFLNIASLGLSGQVVKALENAPLSKWLGGRASFLTTSAQESMRWTPRPVRLRVDDALHEGRITTVAVANGRYFGGGMMVAPNADPADGCFDVVVLGAFTRWERLQLGKLYRGTHLDDRKVEVFRGREVVVEALDDPLEVETDGEPAGQLPARFTIRPGALRLRA